MSDAEIRAALRLTNGDVAQAVLLLSEPLAGPKTVTRKRPQMYKNGVTGDRAGKRGEPVYPYKAIDRVTEMADDDSMAFQGATDALYDSFAVDIVNLDIDNKKYVGRGAFGNVYRITDKETGKIFALKEFNNSDIRNDSVIRELVMLSSVNPAIPTGDGDFRFENRNVVGFFGASTTWKRADYTVGSAILSEFINGEEINKIQLPEIWLHATRIAREMFDGLAFIHSKGVAHGDIKPANIMVEQASDGGRYGRVVIVDLGLACFVEHEMANSVNPYLGGKYTCNTKKWAGTYLYFAPEMVYASTETRNSSVELKFGNDVWAATLTLFEVFADFWYYDQFPALSKGIIGEWNFGDFRLNMVGNFYAISVDQPDLWDVGKQGLLDATFAKYKKDTTGEDMRNVDPQLAEVIEFLAEGASSPDERPAAIEMASRIAVLEKTQKTKKEIFWEILNFSPHYYSLLSEYEHIDWLAIELYAQLFPNTEPPGTTESMLEAILRFWKAERRLYNPLGFKLEKLTKQATLGFGTYGTVYRVVYEPTGEELALKELKRTKIASAKDLFEKVDSVRDELILLASVNPRLSDGTFENKHVAGYIASSLNWTSFGGNANKPRAMILSELINGKDLWKFIGVDGTKGWPHYERIAKELFDGLKFIHSKGVAHRDIKGGNVMLERASDGSPYGRAVIVDLGLSCFVEQDLSEFNTERILRQERTCRDTDVEGGTYYYQSPEIAREYVNSEKERDPVDIDLHYGADVWALGMTIVEFVCGMQPGALAEKMAELEGIVGEEILDALSTNYSPVQSNWARFQSVAFSAVEIAAADADEADNYTPFSAIISQSFLHPEQRPNAATMLELLEGIPVLDE